MADCEFKGEISIKILSLLSNDLINGRWRQWYGYIEALREIKDMDDEMSWIQDPACREFQLFVKKKLEALNDLDYGIMVIEEILSSMMEGRRDEAE